MIFLGGVGEIGKNMTAFEFGEDIIVVDSGLMFPSDDMPGVDLVIPDITYLVENKHKVRGIFITHGHEDHIGALPYVLKQLNVPIYASNITLALLENKFREHRLIDQVKTNVVKKRTVIKAGAFSVEFVKVSHSVAGSFAIHITCPAATVFHTGDFKIDYQPIDGEMTDLARIAELGKRGITLLLAESTNVERQGHSMSESTVGTSLNGFFAENATRRIIIATFASNIHRLQQILDLAKKFKRKVAFSGRSMHNVVEAATKINELKYEKNLLFDVEKIGKYADKDVVVITTGSQGEPMSALTRMASGEFNKVTIGDNDTIIISASPIPGNEKLIYNVINNLYRKGAKVIYDALADVHVSGHAFVEELKLIHALTKPRFFIPVHGEYRHLKQHCELAVKMGVAPHNTFVPDIGNQVVVTKKYMRKVDNVTAGIVLVDGDGIGDVGQEVLRDRKHLSEDGLVIVVIGVNDGGVVSGPDIITRGFVYAKESEEMLSGIKRNVAESLKGADLKERSGWGAVKNTIRRDVKNFLYKKIKRSPMILPIIIEG